jgi:hypothetical protein
VDQTVYPVSKAVLIKFLKWSNANEALFDELLKQSMQWGNTNESSKNNYGNIEEST